METANGTTTYFGKESQPAREAAKPQPLLPPTLTASIDLTSQTMTVVVNGEARYSWPISSGTSRYPTPTGTFHPEWTSKIWYSRKYDWAPMPNAVFINGGVAVHGTYHIGGLGRPASHGCIRLSPANAKTFYNLVERHGLKMTRVTVHGRPNWREEAIASRNRPRNKTYAKSQENWFWGGPWAASQETGYVPSFTKKKSNEYTDAYRRKSGDYKRLSQRRKYSNAKY
jgi:hypothetical protein